MAYLPEQPEWTDGVYQLEKSDPVRGGVDGPANRPLIDLLKRTAWLKQRYEEAFSGLGWAELGEWAVGLEVTTPSQIVHYQGYWYRYGGSLPHTITGASPSLDDDDNWFNLGNDVSLRANLGSSDGEKLIGKCPHVGALRSIEPSYSDQTITLLRVVQGGPVVNLQLSYDADDTTSADDGYSVFVTAGGARWKADTSNGIDVRWAGLNLAGTNLGSCLNKIIKGELAKIISADDYMAGTTKINIKAKNHPKHNSKFILDETVTYSSFFSIRATDFMTVSVITDIDAFIITNNIDGLNPSVTDFVNQQGTAVIDALSGNGANLLI